MSINLVGIVGAGTMGAGIAQVAAQAGYRVLLHDAKEGAASSALAAISKQLEKLVEKGKLSTEAMQSTLNRIQIASELEAYKDCDCIIEAIAEDRAAKQTLLRKLDTLCREDCILASNTSSISITALASGLAHPGRVVGMHFFNPAPILPLVEIVSGRLTQLHVIERAEALALAWQKVPVRCASTPGFIVNRVARPFYGEALRILEMGGAEPATIDLVLREVGGFRMGAFELLDLIGLDVNLMVTRSVWQAYFQDSRYRPSLTQEEMVMAGLLGRKTGRGFYTYPEGPPTAPASPFGPAPTQVQYLSESEVLDPLVDRIKSAGIKVQHRKDQHPYGAGVLRVGNATLALCDGRSGAQIAYEEELSNVVTLDVARDFATTRRVALARAEGTTTAALADAVGLFRALGIEVSLIEDIPGMIVARTLAMLANEAADAVLQKVASAEAIDRATMLGLNHPEGPLETADRIGLTLINTILTHLHSTTGDDRYRQSLLLQRKVWAGHEFR